MSPWLSNFVEPFSDNHCDYQTAKVSWFIAINIQYTTYSSIPVTEIYRSNVRFAPVADIGLAFSTK